MNKEPSSSSKPCLPPYKALLLAGSRLRILEQVHAHLITTQRATNLPLLTTLATAAIASGSLLYARKLLLSTPSPDAFLFSSLINASSKSNHPLCTIFFYNHMLNHNVPPSNYTFTALIKACAQRGDSRVGRLVHCHVLVSGFGVDGYVKTALLSYYGKVGDLGVARKLFDEMPERSVVAWNAMISGYEQNGFAEEAIGLFYDMISSGVAFDSLTFVSVLSACAQTGALELGCWVHEHVKRDKFYWSKVVATALINMYCRCGCVSKAREVFNLVMEPNVVTWTSMISGYAMNGYGREAVELFRLMQRCGLCPNDVTFVAVLSACSHAGLVQEGREVFDQMKNVGVTPGLEHHVCMVDMLGRAGLLGEAYQYVMDLYPRTSAPPLWTALLGACKMHKNYVIGVQAAEYLLCAEPENGGNYVLLSNMFASAGFMDRVEMVRRMMMTKGLKKQIGYSIVEIDQKVVLFCSSDKSHPESTAIYQFLDVLMQKISAAGYSAVSQSAMHELEEEEKEYALRYHSEKLAVAFGLMKTRQGTIRVVKNLRICEDCHMALKLISEISNREISVRDKFRFHHFSNGSCSCMESW